MNPQDRHLEQKVTTGQIAQAIGAALIGDGFIEINGIKPLETAAQTELSFFAPTSAKKRTDLLNAALASKAAAILVSQHEPQITAAQIVTPNPLGAIVMIAERFFPKPVPAPGIDPRAAVDPSASIGENVSIGAFAVVAKDVVIGPETIIHPHVVIYQGAIIGAKCVIHSGAVVREFVRLGSDCLIQNGVVVGGDGFGYFPDKEVGHRRIPHIGAVVLEDHVDLGANTTVDRATLGETTIGLGTKIDNLVMVAHNVHIGQRTLLCSQVGVSGSSTIGSDTLLAGQVGIADHVIIGDRVRVAAKSGVAADVKSQTDVGGYPATDVGTWRRVSAALLKLPQLLRRVRVLERKLGVVVGDD